MAVDLFATGTVLPAPSAARIVRDLPYASDARGALHLDAYRPARQEGASPCVLLVSGDADEQTIAHAKDWGVYRSYGQHLAARGLVGIPFNHRSTERGTRRAEVASQVAAAIAFVRAHTSELEVDAERVGVWAFSAGGPFALAPMLRERPAFVRALAGFYTIWDLGPFRSDGQLSDADVDRWSAVSALAETAAGVPPMFIARAGRDAPRINIGTDRFIARALERNLDVRVHEHASGQHGFDIRDNDERSREIIGAALDFFASSL